MFDIIISGGRIVDGSGSPWYRGDVGINGECIEAIGSLDNAEAVRVIDAAGCVACPGFIDMHSHSDIILLANPRHEPKIMQGVTTDVLGLDGSSYAPLSPANLKMVRQYLSGVDGNFDVSWDWSSVAEFLARFDHRVAINVAYLVPHNALRLETIGFVDRAATPGELVNMQALLDRGINDGAVGFSTGLDYFPNGYSNTYELIKICEVVARYDGVSVWHTRNNDLGLIKSIQEAFEVGEKTGVKVHMSHYAANGPKNRGKSIEILGMVDAARKKGIDVTFDSYPYIALSSMLIMVLPRWVHQGGAQSVMERLSQPALRGKIYSDLGTASQPWPQLILTSVTNEKNEVYVGKSIPDAAKMAGKEVPEFVCDLLLEENLGVSFLGLLGNEDDVRTIMKHPCHMAGSDGILLGNKPNPRGWGTFARYLGFYSLQLGIVSMEEIIRHMTAAPAQCLGLSDRGLIKKGLAADIVVFDPQTVIDKATFDEPKKHPVGINYVLVNGAITVDKGKHTGALNGRSLHRT
jgi:N-acyl-D-amino-acid deacylase